jgi:hypothetical protein
LILLGLLTVFFTGTASLAPRVARRSRTAWRWDRVLTGLGITAAVAMLGSTVGQQSFPVIFDSLVVGSFGLWIGIAHWRGPTDPYHWQVEHLTGMLSAYLVVWWFVFWLYIRALPRVSQTLIPAVPAVGAMLWARRRFAVAPAAPAAWPTRPAIHADQPGS